MKKKVCRNQVFLIFANNSGSKQNKKNPEHPFEDIGQVLDRVKIRAIIFTNSSIYGLVQDTMALMQLCSIFNCSRDGQCKTQN